jgi:hypothetical protein
MAFAADPVPMTINFQGKLTDQQTNRPLDGVTADITFTIFDESAGGEQKWTENHTAVPVIDGLFNALLGSKPIIAGNLDLAGVFTGTEPRWLEVTVNVGGVSETLSPRQSLTSVAYAIRSGSAAEADHATNADDSLRAEDSLRAVDAENAVEAEHALEADHATNADDSLRAEDSLRAVDAENAEEAEHAVNADEADHAVTADFSATSGLASEAAHAAEADHALDADTADWADNAVRADKADRATNADNATAADYATTAGSLTSGSPKVVDTCQKTKKISGANTTVDIECFHYCGGRTYNPETNRDTQWHLVWPVDWKKQSCKNFIDYLVAESVQYGIDHPGSRPSIQNHNYYRTIDKDGESVKTFKHWEEWNWAWPEGYLNTNGHTYPNPN